MTSVPTESGELERVDAAWRQASCTRVDMARTPETSAIHGHGEENAQWE